MSQSSSGRATTHATGAAGAIPAATLRGLPWSAWAVSVLFALVVAAAAVGDDLAWPGTEAGVALADAPFRQLTPSAPQRIVEAALDAADAALLMSVVDSRLAVAASGDVAANGGAAADGDVMADDEHEAGLVRSQDDSVSVEDEGAPVAGSVGTLVAAEAAGLAPSRDGHGRIDALARIAREAVRRVPKGSPLAGPVVMPCRRLVAPAAPCTGRVVIDGRLPAPGRGVIEPGSRLELAFVAFSGAGVAADAPVDATLAIRFRTAMPAHAPYSGRAGITVRVAAGAARARWTEVEFDRLVVDRSGTGRPFDGSIAIVAPAHAALRARPAGRAAATPAWVVADDAAPELAYRVRAQSEANGPAGHAVTVIGQAAPDAPAHAPAPGFPGGTSRRYHQGQ